MKKIVAVLLVIIALAMFYLSYQIGVLPPGLTGVGFILIAIIFLKDKSSD